MYYLRDGEEKRGTMSAFSSFVTSDCYHVISTSRERRCGNIIEAKGERVVLSMEKSFAVGYRLTSPLTHDLVNKLAVIVGHCDLLGEHLKAGSPSAKRVDSIQEIARGMAKELNEYQCQLAECARSAEMKKRGVHRLDELSSAS